MNALTIEQIKEEAKKRFNKDITDEQAQAILENHCSEELSAQALEEVTGGRDRGGDLNIRIIGNLSEEERGGKFHIDFTEEALAALEALHADLLNARLKKGLDTRSSEEMSDQELANVAGGGYYQLDVSHTDRDLSEIQDSILYLERLLEEARKRHSLELTDGQGKEFMRRYGSGELSAQELEEVRGGAHYKLHINFTEEALEIMAAAFAWDPRLKKGLDTRFKKGLDARSSEEMSDQELANVAGGGCGSDDPAPRDPEDDTPQNQQ